MVLYVVFVLGFILVAVWLFGLFLLIAWLVIVSNVFLFGVL